MPKKTVKNNNFAYWFSIGLIAQFVTAPNASIMKVILESMDPTTFNTLRSALGLAVALPFVIWYWRKFNRQNFVYALGAGLCTAIAVTLTTYAIQDSQASYVVVMSLIGPIILVIMSRYFFNEKVHLRAAAGVTLAALGALVAVALPLIAGGRTSLEWYPLATSLILLASIFLPLATIFLRKANEAGLPLTSSQGVSAAIVFGSSFAASFALHGGPVDVSAVPPMAWFGIAYSALFVIFIARVMTTASFERIGSAATSGLNYLGIVVALIIPIVFLHETLSTATIIGGVLILLGVYLTERHHAKHPRHKRGLWHHTVVGH